MSMDSPFSTPGTGDKASKDSFKTPDSQQVSSSSSKERQVEPFKRPPSPSLLRPDLWSEPTAFGERAHFRASASPVAVLSVTGVQRFDAGTFMCRVDFRQSPTVYHTVELDVIGERCGRYSIVRAVRSGTRFC